jgi:hypothetical protein
MQRPAQADFFQFSRYLLWVTEQAYEPDVSDLLAALDGLASTYHDLPQGKGATISAEPPELCDYRARYSTMGRRFPELGLYSYVDTLKPSEAEMGIGDAIDDLVDIAAEMHAILWYLDTTGWNGASARTHQMRYHWLAEHLRPLVLHLEQRRYQPDKKMLGGADDT